MDSLGSDFRGLANHSLPDGTGQRLRSGEMHPDLWGLEMHFEAVALGLQDFRVVEVEYRAAVLVDVQNNNHRAFH